MHRLGFDAKEAIRKDAEKHNRRAIQRLRLYFGLRSIITNPLKLLFPVMVMILATITWNNRQRLSVQASGSIPMLSELWEYIFAISIVIFSLLAIWGLLVLFGLPRAGKDVNAALAQIGLVDHYGNGPTLLSRESDKHNKQIEQLTFFSRGISREAWIKHTEDISDVLNIRMVEEIKYGGRKENNRNYIVITVAPGAQSANPPPLLDDEY